MRENLIWFYNDGCEYCVEMEPEVKEFASQRNATFTPVMSGIVNPETGDAEVPALMLIPTFGQHMFIGRFCLDALRYMIHHG